MTRADIRIPKEADNHDTAVRGVKRAFADRFGGFTAFDGQGGWLDGDGNRIEEPVTVVETVDNGDTDALRLLVRGIAKTVKTTTGEDTVMFVVDGEKTLV